jgi:hypothetical protein
MTDEEMTLAEPEEEKKGLREALEQPNVGSGCGTATNTISIKGAAQASRPPLQDITPRRFLHLNDRDS